MKTAQITKYLTQREGDPVPDVVVIQTRDQIYRFYLHGVERRVHPDEQPPVMAEKVEQIDRP